MASFEQFEEMADEIIMTLPEEAYRRELRHVILHEFRHHLESLAGERDLEMEDERSLEKYRQSRTEGCNLHENSV